MPDLLDTLGRLIAALGNAQAGGVTKERLVLAQEQLRLAKEEHARFEAENRRLRDELAKAEYQLAAQGEREQFAERSGALFKRDTAGAYGNVPYCPKCKVSTAPFEATGTYVCSACSWESSFTVGELAGIIAALR